MKSKTTIGLFLLATTFLSSPAVAATLTPTLDTIKSEAADLSGNFALSELTGDLPTGAVEVKIGDKSYYFTPSGDDAALLATLAGTSAGSLVESPNGIFELNGQKYGFDVASIPDSVFEYTAGTKDDYNFTVQEADAEGNLTDKYYKINLKPEYFSTSKSTKWAEVGEDKKDDKDDDLSDGKISAIIAVRLPNDQTKYFQYTYTKPDGYETITKPELVLPTITDPSVSPDHGLMFYYHTYQAGGVAINNPSGKDYGDIESKVFKDNKVNGKLVVTNKSLRFLMIQGGAVYNGGVMGNVLADFINNTVTGTAEGKHAFIKATGGAIFNDNNATIGDITGDFIGNYASVSETDSAHGGAIFNYGTIGNITGDFIGNYVSGGYIYGGAICNKYAGTIGDISGDFIGNYSTGNYASGGAIFNADYATIGDITGDFIGNYASTSETSGSAYGGAIYNGDSMESVMIGETEEDYAFSVTSRTYDEVIDNSDTELLTTIGNITGDFIGNYASSDYDAYGGAIFNYNYDGIMGDITGDFIGNHASGSSGTAQGGAVYNYAGIIGNITGSFLNNHAESANGKAYGGAIVTTVGIDRQTMKILPFTISSKDKEIFLSGNYVKSGAVKNYNAIHVMLIPDEFASQEGFGDYIDLVFDTTGGGKIIINDSIEGALSSYLGSAEIDYNNQYKLAFKGDGVLNEDGLTDQYVSINNDVINAGAVTVEGTTLRFGAYQHEDKTALNWDGKGGFWATLNPDGTVNKDAAAVTTLSLNNAAFDLYNKYQDMVNLKGWKAAGDSFLHVDVDVENLTADVLNVNGNVEGTTKLVLYPTSNKDIRGESILFAQSTNDTTGNADSFKVWRVYRSPYMFETKYTKTGENANKWELEMNDTANDYAGVEPGERPDPEVPDLPDIPDLRPHPMPNGKRKVAPEVVAMGALPAAAIEQSRNMVDNVASQLTNNRFYTASCSFVDANWNGAPYKQLWVNPTYYTSNYDAPFDIDADVWGIEAGGDLQHDLNNKLGLFVSYRKGSYDMNGDGKHYYSTVGSEIDIDSYLAGLYYRYDRNNWYAFATLYGGIQQADIKTDDGVKSDTDGVEFGASLEAGYDYNLMDTVYLTPSLGVFYTQVNYDDATDSVGKSASYDDLRQIELEAGVKLTKAFRLDEGYANAYVKPSVVQTLVDGDEVNITGLGKVNTLDDETLGRIEFGGRYGFTDQLSAYGWANYTFGSDYDATTVGLGLNYAF